MNRVRFAAAKAGNLLAQHTYTVGEYHGIPAVSGKQANERQRRQNKTRINQGSCTRVVWLQVGWVRAMASSNGT